MILTKRLSEVLWTKTRNLEHKKIQPLYTIFFEFLNFFPLFSVFIKRENMVICQESRGGTFVYNSQYR